MGQYFHVISQFFWLITLAIGAFNYIKARQALLAREDRVPESDDLTYLRRFAIGTNLPWVVMGAGYLLGYTPTVWYYFRPQDRNPFVLAWLAVVFAVCCTNAWWVIFAGGAEKVRDLNLMSAFGQHGTTSSSLLSIKLFAAGGVVLFPAWVLLVISMNANIPK